MEFCAGSARLSSALKERGFAVVPVDWDKNRHTTFARCINIDLTKPGARILFKQLLATKRLRYVHFAPPCGTGSKAREKPISQALQAQGAPSPKPLRSSEHPSGFPWLSGLDLQRVISANSIYSFCAWALPECLNANILVSAENPKSAYLWEIEPWPSLLSDRRLEANDHQVCMLGGTRDKWSRWLATRGLFTSLQMVCDKSHIHKPWGFTAPSLTSGWNFATAEEAEYPAILCQRVAQLVHDKVVKDGAILVPGELQPWGMTDLQLRHLNRASTGKLPRGKVLPQLVSEFDRIEELGTYTEAKNTRLLRQYNKGVPNGTNKAQQVFIFGVFREPGDFLKQAIECKHPIDILHSVDDLTKTALFNILTLGPEAITNKRQKFMDNLELRARELEADEHLLHESMPAHVRNIMAGKRLLLLRELASAAGSKDTGLHKLLTEGTHLTGVTSPSGELFKRVVPAQVTEQELRTQAQWQRAADNSLTKLSDKRF